MVLKLYVSPKHKNHELKSTLQSCCLAKDYFTQYQVVTGINILPTLNRGRELSRAYVPVRVNDESRLGRPRAPREESLGRLDVLELE